jgi:hypothetical protein
VTILAAHANGFPKVYLDTQRITCERILSS